MCTGILETAPVWGSGKGAQGWFALQQVAVSYDHPFHANAEHTLNIDFLNGGQGVATRVAVELNADSARALAQAILKALDRGEKATG